MKGRELKEREVKRQIDELFFKLIITSINEMDKFEQKVRKKIRSIKTNTPKQAVYGRGKKLSRPKIQSKIRNPFILKKIKIKDWISKDIREKKKLIID